MLGDNQHISICVCQAAVLHGRVGRVHVDGISSLLFGTASSKEGIRGHAQCQQSDTAGLVVSSGPPNCQIQLASHVLPCTAHHAFHHQLRSRPSRPSHGHCILIARHGWVLLATCLPAPHIVNMPRTKSTGSAGIGSGLQRSWLGVTTPRLKSAVSCSAGKFSGWKGSCVTEGRMR